MPKTLPPLVLADCRGGVNEYDPPSLIPDDQVTAALNCDSWEGSLAHKRNGATALTLTFASGGPFTGIVGSLVRHVQAGDETAAELWAFDSAGINGRLAGATTWTAPTFTDAVSDAKGISGASIAGFLHLAYDSTQNRSHVWDAALSKVRRTGLATPAAPTRAEMGAGGVSFTRYYRVRYVDVSGSDVRRLSEASAAATVITIASKLGVTVTKPAAISEDETHWDLEASSAAAGPWYRIARTLVATTTYDDTSATISTTNLSPLAGEYTPPPSWKFVTTDGSHVIGVGCHETSGGFTTARNNAVWVTRALGSADQGDHERVPTSFNFRLEAVPTGVSDPIQGSFYVFSYRRIWKFVPTNNADIPFRKFNIRSDVGCIRHQSIAIGEDEFGNPCVYFWSGKGPYRIGVNGCQYLGKDIEATLETVNLAATNTVVHSVYHQDKHQWWVYVATGANNDPNKRLVFDVKEGRATEGNEVRKGWWPQTPASAARCSVMFAKLVSGALGASMSASLKPYAGITTNNTIWSCDSAATDDAGTAFQAYIDTKEYGRLGFNHALREGTLVGEVASGVTITVTLFTDNGLSSAVTGTALLTASGSETRVQKKLEGMQTAGVYSYRLRIGDAAAVANQWTLDGITIPIEEQEQVA